MCYAEAIFSISCAWIHALCRFNCTYCEIHALSPSNSVGNRLSADTYYRPVVNGKIYGKFTCDSTQFPIMRARLAGRWPAAFCRLKALSKLSCKFIFKENPFLLGLVNETKV